MGFGQISFVPYKTTTYKFQTKKPWKEMEGKRILRNSKEEYVILEEVEGAPFYSLETGKWPLIDIQNRYHKANELKSLWNPWYWNHIFIGTENTELLDENRVKSLWNMWDDLWEHLVYKIPDDDDEDKDPDIDYNQECEDFKEYLATDIELSSEARKIVGFCAENNYCLEINTICH